MITHHLKEDRKELDNKIFESYVPCKCQYQMKSIDKSMMNKLGITDKDVGEITENEVLLLAINYETIFKEIFLKILQNPKKINCDLRNVYSSFVKYWGVFGCYAETLYSGDTIYYEKLTEKQLHVVRKKRVFINRNLDFISSLTFNNIFKEHLDIIDKIFGVTSMMHQNQKKL